MNLLMALTIGVLVGSGAYLMLERDLIRALIGTVILSSSAYLFLVVAALGRGRAPILPLPQAGAVSDPLAQAMAVTAIVINFAVAGLLVFLLGRVFDTHGTLNLEEIARDEEAESADERAGEDEED